MGCGHGPGQLPRPGIPHYGGETGDTEATAHFASKQQGDFTALTAV